MGPDGTEIWWNVNCGKSEEIRSGKRQNERDKEKK